MNHSFWSINKSIWIQLLVCFNLYLSEHTLSAQDVGQLAMRGRINLYATWNFDSVAYYFDQVIDKKYTPAFAYSDYGWYLMLINQFDLGMQYIERAAKMKAPDNTQLISWYAWALIWDGDLVKAKQWIDKALTIDPEFGEGLYIASLIASEMNDHIAAIELAKKAGLNDPNWRAGLPLALVKAGRKEEALSWIEQIVQDANAFDCIILMETYAYMRNDVKALEFLEKSYDLRHPFLPWLQFIPAMQYYHTYPKYREIIRKLKLPD